MAEKHQIGTVVLLNGTSSAGKTSIMYELQKIYGDAYQIVLLDDFIRLYVLEHPEAIDSSIAKDALQKHWDALFTLFYQHINTLIVSGKNVFVDTLEYQDEYELHTLLLAQTRIITILVYCPPHVIVEHVEKRNQSGDEREQRAIGQAFRQFAEFYRVKESAEDVVIDRINTVLIKNALDKAKEEIDLDVQHAPSDVALEKAMKNDQFYLHFVQRFTLDEQQEIALVPTCSWDLIVNASVDTPWEIAQKIVAYLERI